MYKLKVNLSTVHQIRVIIIINISILRHILCFLCTLTGRKYQKTKDKGIVEPHSDSSSQPYVKETRQLQ